MEATRDEERSDVIRVRALGASEIIIGRKTIGLSAEMVFALGFYLCARAGQRLRREAVAELFWGDAGEKRGRHSLRQMLYKLRQKGLTLDEDGDELYLDPARVESDLARALEERWPSEAQATEILAAGELLPGFSRAAGPRFQEWLDGLRSQLAAQHRRASVRQIALARREARWADLDRWAHQVLANDPLNEKATFARAESAEMAGSRVVALEILDQYLEELGDRSVELGHPAKVLRRRIAERRPKWSTRAPREVQLVGRTELMSRLTGLVEEASRGNGSAVVLWGAPGIGKTRLAEETRGYAELAGFRTVTVRATAAGSARPLSVFLALIPQLRELPGAAGCNPVALAVLDRIVRGQSGDSRLDEARSLGSVRATVIASLQELIDAVSHEGKVLGLLDDLHNVDGASWELLLQLMQVSPTHRVLWVGTSRLQPALGTAMRQPPSTTRAMHVPPLSDTESYQLTAALREGQTSQGHEGDVAALSALSGGNPLFIRELSTGLDAHQSVSALPRSLRALMEDRLLRLDADSVRVLRIASLLGPFASVPRLRLLHPVTSTPLAGIVERLELDGIIKLNDARTVELHECWHQSVNESLRGATRAVLADECARMLSSEIQPESDADLLWRAAELSIESGDIAAGLGRFARCADRHLALGYPTAALSILERAYPLARNDTERVLIGVRLATALSYCMRAEESVQLCSKLLSLPQQESSSSLANRATLLCLRMDSLTKSYGDHRTDLMELAVLAKDERLAPQSRQQICLSCLRVVFNDSPSSLEELFYHESVALESRFGPSPAGVLAQLIFSIEHGLVEEIESLVERIQRAQIGSETSFSDYLAQRVHIIALRRLGRFEEALRLAGSAYASFRSRGFVEEAASISETAAFACLDENELDLAAQWLLRFEQSERPELRGHAQSHARARLMLQNGDYRGALECCLPGLELTNRDLLEKRRIAELATIAYCATQTGDETLSHSSLQVVEEFLTRSDPSCFLDYPMELAIRSRMALGDNSRAQDLAAGYSRRRQQSVRLPAAPFFAHIRASLATT